MERYFRNTLNNQVAHYTRQDLIDKCLTKAYQVGTEMVEIDGQMVEQPIYEKVWEEITKEQADALNPPMEEPSEQEIAKQQRIAEIKSRLSQLSEDIIQDQVGEYVPDMAERKNEFITLHNELRELEGKTPRNLKTDAKKVSAKAAK